MPTTETQHALATRLLPLVREARFAGKKLNFKDVAVKLGRDPKRDIRVVAAACDMLDGAAAWAKVPLLALTTVMNTAGKVNPSAFDNDEIQRLYRDDIIRRSWDHNFTSAEYEAIATHLSRHASSSRISIWESLFGPKDAADRKEKEEGVFRLLAWDPGTNDAIDDLGSALPRSSIRQTRHFFRSESIRSAVLDRAQGRCEHCGQLGFMKSDGVRYLETHHIIRLADDGRDTVHNVIALCPGDHREAHFGERAETLEETMEAKVKAANAVLDAQ
ncbi:HNH endonuclease signature motif containing protein [Beijerinckia sp. L45]|uniref:HNH endonuclease n=1 Tax=Beijerinckia sp. L45 TaxID=1641855 RepID=UPI001FEFCC52|nr:HNH endonuclease signature motif containing protein [Beijerinckia sp. L45]